MVRPNVNPSVSVDLEAISLRILALAQQAAAEHLAANSRSQAEGLMELMGKLEQEDGRGLGKWR